MKSVKDAHLSARLSNAYTFNISFENGTKTMVSDSGELEIGTRMMFQLRRDGIASWGAFSKEKTNQCLPDKVIASLAEAEGKRLEDMTVIILVDGIQELPHKNGDKNSMMKATIDSVVQVLNSAPFFCIVAVAGTFYGNVADVLASSPQMRVYLTPPSLDGHMIIKSTDLLVRQLIDDMGGHGRALEALDQELKRVDITTCSASTFMNNIRASLEQKYPHINLSLLMIYQFFSAA